MVSILEKLHNEFNGDGPQFVSMLQDMLYPQEFIDFLETRSGRLVLDWRADVPPEHCRMTVSLRSNLYLNRVVQSADGLIEKFIFGGRLVLLENEGKLVYSTPGYDVNNPQPYSWLPIVFALSPEQLPSSITKEDLVKAFLEDEEKYGKQTGYKKKSWWLLFNKNSVLSMDIRVIEKRNIVYGDKKKGQAPALCAVDLFLEGIEFAGNYTGTDADVQTSHGTAGLVPGGFLASLMSV